LPVDQSNGERDRRLQAATDALQTARRHLHTLGSARQQFDLFYVQARLHLARRAPREATEAAQLCVEAARSVDPEDEIAALYVLGRAQVESSQWEPAIDTLTAAYERGTELTRTQGTVVATLRQIQL